MARIRTIKPEFWRNEDLSLVSAETALLAIGLLNHADDEGYFNANPKLIESDVFPLRELSGSVTVMLTELAGIGYITLYEGSDGKRYGVIENFIKHQVINKRVPSKIKELCTVEYDYRSPTVVLPSGKERKGKEREKEEERNIAPGRTTPKISDRDLLAEIGVDGQLADDFIQLRKTKKAPISKTVIDGIYREAGLAGISPQEAVSICVERGWQGFKADWLKQNQAKNKFGISSESLGNFLGEDF